MGEGREPVEFLLGEFSPILGRVGDGFGVLFLRCVAMWIDG